MAALRRRGCLVFDYYSHGKHTTTLDWSRGRTDRRPDGAGTGVDLVWIAPTPTDRYPVSARAPWRGARRRHRGVPHAVGLSGPWAGCGPPAGVAYAFRCAVAARGARSAAPAPPAQQIYDQLPCTRAPLRWSACGTARSGVGSSSSSLSTRCSPPQDGPQPRPAPRGIPYPPRRTGRLGAVPTGVWPAKDGFVELMAHNPAHWYGFLRVIGTPDDLADPRSPILAVRMQQEAELARVSPLARSPSPSCSTASRTSGCRARRGTSPRVRGRQPAREPGLLGRLARAGGGRFRAPALPFRSVPETYAPREPARHPRRRAAWPGSGALVARCWRATSPP